MTEGLAAIALFNESEAADLPAVHRTLRDLIGRMPVIAESEIRERQAVALIALAVADDAVELVFVVRAHPWPVVALPLERAEQVSAADARRGGAEEAPVAERSAGQRHNRPVEDIEVIDVCRSRRGEVAVLRVVRSLAELDAAHQLGHQEIRVCVALRVRVRRHVDRQAGNRLREIETVIEVEASEV